MNNNNETTTGIISIAYQYMKPGPDLDALLEQHAAAERVRLEFLFEGECSVLMHDRHHVVECLSTIAAKLQNLTHVVIDCWNCVISDKWFVHCDFPIEALGKIFQARADTLVSLVVEGQVALCLEGSQKQLNEAMGALEKAEKLQELDLSKLSWLVVPEIHTSKLAKEHASDFFGYVIDPNGKPLDVNPLLKAIHSLSSIQTLGLRFHGCHFKEECSILQDLVVGVESLQSLSLYFYVERQSDMLDKEEISVRLNGVLESALASDTTLENLQVKSGFGSRTTSGFLKLADVILSLSRFHKYAV